MQQKWGDFSGELAALVQCNLALSSKLSVRSGQYRLEPLGSKHSALSAGCVEPRMKNAEKTPLGCSRICFGGLSRLTKGGPHEVVALPSYSGAYRIPVDSERTKDRAAGGDQARKGKSCQR